MARKAPKADHPQSVTEDAVTVYTYPARRKNNPPAGIEAHGSFQEAQRIRHEYNPHLAPVLRSSPEAATTDALPELLRKALHGPLSKNEVELLAYALRKHEPWLEWSGKREKPWFEVDPVFLHIHERISTQTILRVLARQDVQRHLFADPQLEYAKAVQFYQHDVDWSNRMILGDSLQVMASLARHEDLAGKVQMIYMDPPYGIKFSSNFQPQLGQRDVKDRAQDLTREPEMVKAYRDTWTLGIHSYLAYLRDRLAMARELLADTESIFVQIGDANLHRVRCLMDEIFGPKNFVGLIVFRTTGGQATAVLAQPNDFLLWYAKDRENIHYQQLYLDKNQTKDGARFEWGQNYQTGEVRQLGQAGVSDDSLSWEPMVHDNLTSQGLTTQSSGPTKWNGQEFRLPANSHWKTNPGGLERLAQAERLMVVGSTLRFKRFLDDFPVAPIHADWDDTAFSGFGRKKEYVVETNAKVIERCILMTTDPGDLVMDPTCGSGTTAYVAEQWGRRWITMDTSRVALALARQRLMTARFAYYKMRPASSEDLRRNPKGAWLTEPSGKIDGKATFQCKTVPHITLKSIARNTSLDPIFAKHEPILAECLQELNAGIKDVTPETRQRLAAKLAVKQKHEGKKAITDADRRRWQLPKEKWKEWEVPFDTDPDWPKTLQDALVVYRRAWRAKMDEVNAFIAHNADVEELVDKPEIINGVVRVSGPFTMEGVIDVERGPDSPIGGAPNEDLETFEDAGQIEAANAEAHIDKILRLLKAAGVDFRDNKNMKFTRLEPIVDSSLLQAEGAWANGDQNERRVAVSIGPEVGNVTAYQVEEAVRTANRRGYDDLVFAGFGFDAEAQAAIEEASHPHLRVHMALIRPDVHMDDLLKTQPGSQIFTVFSSPQVKAPELQKGGQYVVEVEGMDVYDPVSNTLHPTSRDRIAAWFLDSDYDGRTFCICQAFFPDKKQWAKLAKALGQKGVIEESAFESLSGLRSLPFPKGKYGRIAVKVIDPRGNDGLRVVRLP
jgi:adenine-specific DNA-methyltransferase